MGWASGGDLFTAVMEAVYPALKRLPKWRREQIGMKIVHAFEDFDWDTLEEGVDHRWPWVEEYIREKYPGEDEDT